MVHIYVDGACSGNPGIGGYGCIIRYKDREITLSGAEPNATNNRMELLSAIVALESLKAGYVKATVTSDSQYLVKGASEWVKDWVRRGWRTQNRKKVANRELWERLLKAVEGRYIEWIWVRGHDGHVDNERCDALAKEAIANQLFN